LAKNRLWVTTDFVDDLLRAGRHFEERDIDELMAYSASLGAECHEWILDTIWTLYDEDSPVGFDLLETACEAAHRHGMRFQVMFKPFEGGTEHMGVVLPATMPRPEEKVVLEEQRGLLHAVRPFVAAHPEMRIARWAADDDPGGRVAAIRLVKNDDGLVGFGLEDLTILTSCRNGGYEPYDGPVELEESVEWRPCFPWRDSPCRILTLGGLNLPADAKFFLIRCKKGDGAEGFTNAVEKIVELVNECGCVIPSMPSLRRADAKNMFERASRIARLEITRYARRHPEARRLLCDEAWFLEQCRDMHRFDAGWEDACLERDGEVAVARGKPRYNAGSLHPIYPEVREHWLEHVRFCIDRGVDGVNIRTANHNRPYEPWAYGFNEPVLERMTRWGNIAEARRINGDAYTQFLREAADLLHRAGREMGVHAHGLMLRHCDRAANNIPFPCNFDWQWETWVREIADYVEYRGAFFLRPENQREVADRIGLVAREAGKPLVYQSMRGEMVHFDGPHHALAWEMDWVRNHPDVAAYNLYETANFSRLHPDGWFEGSPDFIKLVRRHWHGRKT